MAILTFPLHIFAYVSQLALLFVCLLFGIEVGCTFEIGSCCVTLATYHFFPSASQAYGMCHHTQLDTYLRDVTFFD